MKIIEADVGDDGIVVQKRLKDCVFIEVRHSSPEDVIEEIDKLLRKHKLQIVLGDIGQSDGYLVKVEKLK